MNGSEHFRGRETAYHYAGAAVIGLWVGRKVATVGIGGAREDDGILEWEKGGSARILRAYGDFLDFASAHALVSYGAGLAEEIAVGGAPDFSYFPNEEAARRTNEVLNGWREVYPGAVAYVEEFLDLPALRRTARQALDARWPAVGAVAGRLLEEEAGRRLPGCEVEEVIAKALSEDEHDAAREGRS